MNDILYIDDYQMNETIIGTVIFIILFTIYKLFFSKISIVNILYTGFIFLVIMYSSHLGYNFSSKYF